MNAPYHWSELTIRNYKSIGELHLACSRINVFIGPPNSGKSNILEALELPSLTYLMGQGSGPGKVDCKRHFRVDSVYDLFHFSETSTPISISGTLSDERERKEFWIQNNSDKKRSPQFRDYPEFSWLNWEKTEVPFTADFQVLDGHNRYPFFGTSYRFPEFLDFEPSQGIFQESLLPPFGINLGTTIRLNPSLQSLFAQELKESSGAELVVDKASGKLSIQFRTEQNLVVGLSYKALSDTFRRMFFYTAAIRTSLDDILILEEPEALSFPPYITRMALEIVEASEQKQFFIATHSPYLLNTLIEQTPKENLSVFVCSYQKAERQTKARMLSDQDLREVLDYGLDVFFNLDPYHHEEEPESGV